MSDIINTNKLAELGLDKLLDAFNTIILDRGEYPDKKAIYNNIPTDNIIKALNQYFSGHNCTQVKLTDNDDNEFFGIVISTDRDYDYLFNYDQDLIYTVSNYSVEIDSKLLNNLYPGEVVALLLREINAMLSPKTLSRAHDCFDAICAYKGIVVHNSDIARSSALFDYAVKDLIRNEFSIFCKNLETEIVVPDDILVSIGLDRQYTDALEKIINIDNPLQNQINSSSLLMNWYLSLYNDIDSNNRYVIGLLRKCMKLTGSVYIKRLIFKAISQLEEIDQSSMNKYRSMLEAATDKKKNSLFSKIKYNGLKSLEDDLYEYTIRVKNVDTEEDAIHLMRLISSRMEILDDYLHNEEDLSDHDRERWEKLFDKYEKLRDELSKKTIYKNKQYGLFVDYNALNQMYGNKTSNDY